MRDLIIHTEHNPTRCEICHQADLFNPQTNICLRCSDIGAVNKPKKKKKGVTHDRFKLPLQRVAISVMANALFHPRPEQQRPFRNSEVKHRQSRPVANNHQKAIGYVSINGVNSYFTLPIRVKPKRKLKAMLFGVVVLVAILYFIQYFSS